ncbi:MAG: hypothetical protein WBC44_12230 [Planctomycetaceae bacterium]
MAQVYATFPGIVSVESASYTLGHGITPSTGEITFAPQPHPPAREGTLILSDGIVGLAVPGCVLDSASVVRDGSGYAVSAQVIDRRWKWRFGEIYGRYNLRDKGNVIIEDTKKTPQELATELLEAMGEQGVDVSALPPEPLPEVDWDGDVPADELAELVETCGCRVGLDVTGATRIWKLGEGAAAPGGPVERRGGDMDPPEPPDTIVVRFAQTVIQMRFDLEAVGRDTDGEIKLIDDLSYTPENGWEKETDLFGSITDEKARVYCLQSVFRWYRVKLPEASVYFPRIAFGLRELSQILPLRDSLVETWTDPKDFEKKPKPAKVYGTYWIRNSGTPKNSSKDDNWECPVKFRLLADLGVIAFDETVKKFNGEAGDDPAAYEFGPAELKVDVAFAYLASSLRRRVAHDLRSSTGSQGGTGPEVVSARSEGGVKLYQFREDPTSDEFEWKYAEKGSPDHLDAIGRKYFDEALKKWTMTRGESLTYSGIVAVPVDGLNVQASFSVSSGGAVTTLSRSRETAVFAPEYGERRARERGRRLVNRERRRGEPARGFTVLRGGDHQGER